jgi:hypothetical protein
MQNTGEIFRSLPYFQKGVLLTEHSTILLGGVCKKKLKTLLYIVNEFTILFMFINYIKPYRSNDDQTFDDQLEKHGYTQ